MAFTNHKIKRFIAGNIKLVFFLISSQSLSQNMLMNPSFEKTKICVEDFGKFDQEVFFWSTPNAGTTDLYNACNRGFVGVPVNFHGKQQAFDGEKYAGCYFLAPDNYREYVQGKLSQQLIQGEEYKISFYVNLSDNSVYSITNIDFLFSHKKIELMDFEVLDLSKLEENEFTIFYNNNGIFYEDKANWTLITKTFVAKGYENYLTIGNFNKDSKTRKRKLDKHKKSYMSYYYIDLVNVETIEDNNLVSNKSYVVEEIKPNRLIEDIVIGKDYVFNNVIFEFNSVKLSSEAKKEIDEVFSYLSLNKATKITIMGHTDNIGSDEFNKVLSKKRAESVMNYLIKKGISEARVTSVGFGNSKPRVSNNTEKGRSKNRRVEFKITKYYTVIKQ